MRCIRYRATHWSYPWGSFARMSRLPKIAGPIRGTTRFAMTDESALRDVLNVERAATVARIRAMQADLDAIVAASANTNNDDEHDPEGSTIAYEKAQVGALLAAAQSNLGDLDFALARLTTGRYSVCERCHAHISSERLAALPAGGLVSTVPTARPEHSKLGCGPFCQLVAITENPTPIEPEPEPKPLRFPCFVIDVFTRRDVGWQASLRQLGIEITSYRW